MFMKSVQVCLACLVICDGILSSLGVPQPIRFYWNYPDSGCRNRHINFRLADYGIIYNGRGFLGEEISTLYSSKFGMWPRITATGTWVNGGLPQYANLTTHLAKLQHGLKSLNYGHKPGLAVLDAELWRPAFRSNYGSFKPYIPRQLAEVKKLNPHLTNSELNAEATHIWENSTRVIMDATLKEAKKIWPKKLWGYYGYPEYSSRKFNHQLKWLWDTCDAFYPSIYIKSFKQKPAVVKNTVRAKLTEAFRVRAFYGRPDIPIIAYSLVQTTAIGKFYGDWLDLAIKLPAEMGIDGIVLWASSKEFASPVTTNCQKQQIYVQKTLGPKIKEILARMTRCSFQLCGGSGRCVRKEYVGSNKYIQVRYPLKSESPISTRPLPVNSTVDKDFQDNFVCQCYKSWAGQRCENQYKV